MEPYFVRINLSSQKQTLEIIFLI